MKIANYIYKTRTCIVNASVGVKPVQISERG